MRSLIFAAPWLLCCILYRWWWWWWCTGDCTLYRPIRHDGADPWSLFWQNCPTISPRLANQFYLNPWQHTISLSALTRDVDSDMPPHTMAYHPPPPLLPRPEMSPLHPLHHHPPPPPFQHFPPHFPALGPTNSFSTPSGGEYKNISK